MKSQPHFGIPSGLINLGNLKEPKAGPWSDPRLKVCELKLLPALFSVCNPYIRDTFGRWITWWGNDKLIEVSGLSEDGLFKGLRMLQTMGWLATTKGPELNGAITRELLIAHHERLYNGKVVPAASREDVLMMIRMATSRSSSKSTSPSSSLQITESERARNRAKTEPSAQLSRSENSAGGQITQIGRVARSNYQTVFDFMMEAMPDLPIDSIHTMASQEWATIYVFREAVAAFNRRCEKHRVMGSVKNPAGYVMDQARRIAGVG